MIRRIDPVGRLAYGVLCIAAMAAISMPPLLVTAPVTGAIIAIDGDGSRGLLVWLAGWLCAVFAAGLVVTIFFAMWPFASDWVTEWGGYALGFAMAAVGLAVMAVLVLVVSMPLYLAVLLPIAGTVAAGIAVAGRLAGLDAPAAQPRVPARALRKR